MNIDRNTKIELYTVVAGLPILIGAIMWIGSLNEKVNATDTKVERNSITIERNQEAFKNYAKEQLGLTLDIRDRVIRIEEKVKKGE